MITPDVIVAKAIRAYPKAVKAWICDDCESLFPYRVPVNLALAKDHAIAIAEVEQLRKSSKQARGFGYRIEYESRRSRTHGLNQFPIAIWIDTMEDLVRLAAAADEWDVLTSAVTLFRSRRPELARWLGEQSNWRKILDVASVLPGLLNILDYLVAHPRPNCFARELPIAVSTKLLQSHRRLLASWLDLSLPPSAIDHRYGYESFEPRYGLRYVQPHFLLRTLDASLLSELGLPFDELSLPAEALMKLPVKDTRIFIVENKVNLLTLPKLNRAIALGGLGNGVTQLADIGWLHANPVYYWGDLDAEGFVILDRLRRLLGGVQSVLMNDATFESFEYLATTGNVTEAKELDQLHAAERSCYEYLCRTHQRIEQEHLPMDALLHELQKMEMTAENWPVDPFSA